MLRLPLNQPQLFLDETRVAESRCLGRMWHTPVKRCEPVLRGDEPWERDRVVAYGTVLRQQGVFRMWYVSFNLPEGSVCYAESSDGVHWTKPRLGLCDFHGSRDNNILFTVENGYVDNLGVIDDPSDRAWPLKMIYWRRQWKTRHGANCAGDVYGLCAARSKDGIHWDHTPGLVLPDWGDRTNVMPARENGRVVVFGKYMPFLERAQRNVITRVESDDLVHWSQPEVVLAPDLEDGPRLGFYSASPFRYHGLHMALIERFHVTPDVLDPELSFSHDGRAWSRPRERAAFIPRGAPGAWDSGWISFISGAPIPSRGRLLFFYSGRAHGHYHHDAFAFKAIGVAALRVDGFASLYAQETPGLLLTPPMRWPGGELALNADPRRDLAGVPRRCSGEVAAEVRSADGKPLRGFSFADSVPVTHNTSASNELAQGEDDASSTVTWKSGRRMAALKGRSLRLALRLRDAHLFSFKARPTS